MEERAINMYAEWIELLAECDKRPKNTLIRIPKPIPPQYRRLSRRNRRRGGHEYISSGA